MSAFSEETSLNIQVLMLVAVRKVMEKIFTLHELEVLDDLMPESIKKKKAEALKKKDDDYEYDEDDDEFCHHDDVDGKKVKAHAQNDQVQYVCHTHNDRDLILSL